MSSIDSGANRAKRPLWSRAISAPKSWQVRTIWPAAAGSRLNQVPGVEAIDSTPVVTPFLSSSSTAFCTDQSTWVLKWGILRASSQSSQVFW
jgi:hypothetical protein